MSMLFFHLEHASSLQDISNGLRSIIGNINHLGCRRVSFKSTLNGNRGWRFFLYFYYALPNYLRQLARFSPPGLLEYDGNLPLFANLSHEKVYEIQVARKMKLPLDSNSILVFDIGLLPKEEPTWIVRVLKTSILFLRGKKVLQDCDIRLSNYKKIDQYSKLLRSLTFLKVKAKYQWHMSNLITFIHLTFFVKIDLWKWTNQPSSVLKSKILYNYLFLSDRLIPECKWITD